MIEGYYWIQHNGKVQVAYYSNGVTEDLETGQTIYGVWQLTMDDDLCNNGEVEVLDGPLQAPV